MNTIPPPAPAGADPRVAFFDQLAPIWDHECSQPATMLARLEGLNGELGLRPGMSVLELGCGTGLITGWLEAQVRPGRVVGADFSPAMLAEARRRGLAAEFQALDICATAPEAAAFDLVLCLNAFPHFRDQPAALRHIARALKPAGRLIVLHLAGSAHINTFHAGLREPVCHDRLPGAEAWPALLAPAGLAAERLTDREDLFLLQARHAEGDR